MQNKIRIEGVVTTEMTDREFMHHFIKFLRANYAEFSGFTETNYDGNNTRDSDDVWGDLPKDVESGSKRPY